MFQPLLLIAGANGFLAVSIGAFAAHGLESFLSPEQLQTFQTGVDYHMYHSLALFGVGLLSLYYPSERLPKVSGYFFLLGILFFSGSLYMLGITDIRWLGAITPIGGLFFLAGWGALCIFGLKSNNIK